MRRPFALLLLVLAAACGKDDKPRPADPPIAPALDASSASVARQDAAADGWREYTVEGTVVQAPAPPEKHTIEIPGPTGPVPSNQYFFTPNPSGMLAVSMFTMPQLPGEIADYDGALIGGRDGMVGTYGGKLLSDQLVTIDGAQGRDFRFDGGDDEVGPILGRALILVRDGRVYQVFYLHTADAASFPPIGDRFLSSFRFAR